VGGAVEAALKTIALVVLTRRPADQIRGSKPVRAALVVLVNSGGAAPLAYVLLGRRRPGSAVR
jgi:hypothetical protein